MHVENDVGVFGKEFGDAASELVEHGEIAVEHFEALLVVVAHRADRFHVHVLAVPALLVAPSEVVQELDEAGEKNGGKCTC